MNVAEHPIAEQLAAFGLGKLDEAESAVIEAHLAECDSCRQALESPPADSLLALARTARASDADVVPRGSPTGRDARTCEYSASATEVPVELLDHPRYRIIGLLGAGGMGAVFKAEHLIMQRVVALKVINRALLANPTMIDRFRREAQAAARLAHPNIVHAYDADQAGDVHFLVMEFVEGISLSNLLAEHGPLPIPQACAYIHQAALGLQHAFERGMVHRDVKPQNLMVAMTLDERSDSRTSAPSVVKILDFGLARFAQETAPMPMNAGGETLANASGSTPPSMLTEIGTVMGTPDYIAPEQARDPHAADIRSDIYSLGCTLYDLLTGKPPFPEGTVMQKVIAHLERTPRPVTELRADVPAELARVVEKMLAKDPGKRYQTPVEVAAALVPWSQAPVVAGPPAASPSASSVAAVLNIFGIWSLLLGVIAFGATLFEAYRYLTATEWSGPSHIVEGLLLGVGGVLFAGLLMGHARALQSTPSASPPQVSRRRRVGWVALCVIAMVGLIYPWAPPLQDFAQTVIRIATNRGVLVIEADDRDLEIIIEQQGKETVSARVIRKQTKETFELQPVNGELSVTQILADGTRVRMKTTTLEFNRSGRQTFSARMFSPAEKQGQLTIVNGLPHKVHIYISSVAGKPAILRTPDEAIDPEGKIEKKVEAGRYQVRYLIVDPRIAGSKWVLAETVDVNAGAHSFVRLAPDTPAFQPLFDGNDLSEWFGDVQKWKLQDGQLSGAYLNDKGVPQKIDINLSSLKTYRDYELRFEACVPEGGRAGVMMRGRSNGFTPIPMYGLQVVLGDNAWGDVARRDPVKNLPRLRAGSRTGQFEKAFRKNDFNDVWIRCVGQLLTIKINGVTVMEEDFADLGPALNAHAGRIVFWNESDSEVVFRNIRIHDHTPPLSEPVFRPLFNGTNLNGWTGQVDSYFAKKDGSLLANPVENEYAMLRTIKSYENYELRLQCKLAGHLQFGSKTLAGVAVHVNDAAQPHFGVALRVSSGRNPEMSAHGIGDLGEVKSAQANKPPSEGGWHDVRIVCQDRRVTIYFNGEERWSCSRSSRSQGHIGLWAREGDVHFKNIEIKELPPSPERPAAPLFEARDDLTGWDGDVKHWKMAAGQLTGVFRNEKGVPEKNIVALWSNKPYGDFELQFEARVPDDGRAGVMVRARQRGFVPIEWLGLQVILGDKSWGDVMRRQSTKIGLTRTGTRSDAFKKALRDGDFNHVSIRCVGELLTVSINGHIVQDEIFPDLGVNKSGDVGHIVFWNEGATEAVFRNLQIKDLSPVSPDPPFEPLFNGKDLSNWVNERNAWTWKDGTLEVHQDANIFDKMLLYGGSPLLFDFELKFRAHTRGGAYVGVLLRSDVEYRFGTKHVEGLIASLTGASAGSVMDYNRLLEVEKLPATKKAKAILKDNEFNDYWIRYVGNRVKVQINGVTTVDWEVKEPRPNAGHIAFALLGSGANGTVKLRDIQVRKLRSAPVREPDEKRIQGAWNAISGKRVGAKAEDAVNLSEKELESYAIVIDGDKLHSKAFPSGTFKLSGDNRITINQPVADSVSARYALEDDMLVLEVAGHDAAPSPPQLPAKEEKRTLFLVLKRDKSAEIQPAAFQKLFKDKDLDAWSGDLANWSWREDALVATVPASTHLTRLWSQRVFHNFALEFDVRVPAKGTVNVLFRGDAEALSKKTGLAGFHVNLPGTNTEFWGTVVELRGNTWTVVRKNDPLTSFKAVKNDDWNRVNIRCIDKWLQLQINGRTIIDDPLPFEVGEQLKAGGVLGFLCQGEGEISFRNLRVRTLGAVPPPEPASQPLFNGKDLDAWNILSNIAKDNARDGIAMQNNELEFSGTNNDGLDLRALVSKQAFDDFELKFRAKFVATSRDGKISLRLRTPMIEGKQSPFSDGVNLTFRPKEKWWRVLFNDGAKNNHTLVEPTNGADGIAWDDFNDFVVRFASRRLSVTVNQKQLVDAVVDRTLHPNLTLHPPIVEGRLAWTVHHGGTKLILHDVEIKELPRDRAWQPLFKGYEFADFDGDKRAFRLWKDGTLECRRVAKSDTPLLWSKKNYKDFELKFNAKFGENANYLACTLRGQTELRGQMTVVTGPELRIGHGWDGTLYERLVTGTKVLFRPDQVKAKALAGDELHAYHIRCVGKRMTITINDVTVVDDNIRFNRDEGPIVLQILGDLPANNQEQMHLHDIEIKELPHLPR